MLSINKTKIIEKYTITPIFFRFKLYCIKVKTFQMTSGMLETIGYGKEESVKFYNNWVDHVKTIVPSNRLLVFEVKEGWKPLCDFLQLTYPDLPFPRVNDSAEILWNFKKLRMISCLTLWGFPIILSIVLFFSNYG